MSISVDDCIDLDGMERSILAKVKILSVISELLKTIMSSEGFDDVGLKICGGRWVGWNSIYRSSGESVKNSKADLVGSAFGGASWALEVSRSWGVGGDSKRVFGMFSYRKSGLNSYYRNEFDIWSRPNIESMEVNSESSSSGKGKDAEV
ncbi:hypothetical protein Tco_0674919 [Tanacetum coccineum]